MEASDYHAVSIGSWDSALTSGTAAALAGAGAGAAGGGGYQAGLQTTGSGGGTGPTGAGAPRSLFFAAFPARFLFLLLFRAVSLLLLFPERAALDRVLAPVAAGVLDAGWASDNALQPWNLPTKEYDRTPHAGSLTQQGSVLSNPGAIEPVSIPGSPLQGGDAPSQPTSGALSPSYAFAQPPVRLSAVLPRLLSRRAVLRIG